MSTIEIADTTSAKSFWMSKDDPHLAPIAAIPVHEPWIPASGTSREVPRVSASFEDLLDRLVKRWVNLACRHARARKVDHATWVADIVGIEGAWVDAPTRPKALAALPSVVDEWVRMKLADGDLDIPPMEGLKLVVED